MMTSGVEVTVWTLYSGWSSDGPSHSHIIPYSRTVMWNFDMYGIHRHMDNLIISLPSIAIGSWVIILNHTQPISDWGVHLRIYPLIKREVLRSSSVYREWDRVSGWSCFECVEHWSNLCVWQSQQQQIDQRRGTQMYLDVDQKNNSNAVRKVIDTVWDSELSFGGSTYPKVTTEPDSNITCLSRFLKRLNRLRHWRNIHARLAVNECRECSVIR